MKGFAAAILAAGLVLSAPVAAADRDPTTETWLVNCNDLGALLEYRPYDEFRAGQCIGFIDAYLQSWAVLYRQGHKTFCGPSAGVSANQARLIWKKYMERHPEELQVPAIKTLHWSMLNAFPCPKG